MLPLLSRPLSLVPRPCYPHEIQRLAFIVQSREKGTNCIELEFNIFLLRYACSYDVENIVNANYYLSNSTEKNSQRQCHVKFIKMKIFCGGFFFFLALK